MYLGVVRCILVGCRLIGIFCSIGHVPRWNRKIPPEGIEELVPMVIGKVIPEGIAELNLSYEGMGVSILEGILEKESSGKIIFDLFPDMFKKFSLGG